MFRAIENLAFISFLYAEFDDVVGYEKWPRSLGDRPLCPATPSFLSFAPPALSRRGHKYKHLPKVKMSVSTMRAMGYVSKIRMRTQHLYKKVSQSFDSSIVKFCVLFNKVTCFVGSVVIKIWLL